VEDNSHTGQTKIPVTWGGGKRLFADGTMPAACRLTSSEATPSGVIVASYERAGDVWRECTTETEERREREKRLHHGDTEKHGDRGEKRERERIAPRRHGETRRQRREEREKKDCTTETEEIYIHQSAPHKPHHSNILNKIPSPCASVSPW
jgi:hypothetical protein